MMWLPPLLARDYRRNVIWNRVSSFVCGVAFGLAIFFVLGVF